MKKSRVFGIVSLFIVLILVVAGYFMFRTEDFGTSLPKNFPKDVPIIAGDIVSSKALRSDDLVRVLDVKIQTKESFKNVVEFYEGEFKKNATKELNQPNFTGDPYSNQATGIAEFGKKQVVVIIQAAGEGTEVWVQVRGDSIFSLPK